MYYKKLPAKHHLAAKSLCKSIDNVYVKGKAHGKLTFRNISYKPDIEEINAFFNTSDKESFFIAVFAYKKIALNESINVKDILDWLSIGIVYVPEVQKIIDGLYKKKLIVRDEAPWGKKEFKFGLSDPAYQALITGSKEYLKKPVLFDVTDLMQKIYALYRDLREEKIELLDYESECEEAMDRCSAFSQVKLLKDQQLNPDEQILLLTIMAFSVITNNHGVNVEKIVHMIDRQNIRTLRSLLDGKHPLIKNKIIEFEPGDYKSCQEMHMTGKFYAQLGFETEDLHFDKSSLKYGTLTFPEDIHETNIYLNEPEKKALSVVEKVIQKCFLGKGKDPGIQRYEGAVKVLAEGPSGVGKSQSVLNLAKRNGLCIYEVRASKMKDMWVGATEKAYEGAFIEFRTLQQKLSKTGYTVVFVINELEGILAGRMKNESSVNFMVSSATSIFLKEMERFQGVMFATCNHSQGFIDKAAFRRFDTKIYFSEPDFETRVEIFSDRFPDLSNSEVKTICMKYKLTGGQIENICKRYHFYKLAGEKDANIELIETLCENETSFIHLNTHKIGFRA